MKVTSGRGAVVVDVASRLAASMVAQREPVPGGPWGSPGWQDAITSQSCRLAVAMVEFIEEAPMSLACYEERLGALRLRALRVGGELLLDRVEASAGPAIRHLERVRAGQLDLGPAVVLEIERALDAADLDVVAIAR